jgi:hypothetical protein
MSRTTLPGGAALLGGPGGGLGPAAALLLLGAWPAAGREAAQSSLRGEQPCVGSGCWASKETRMGPHAHPAGRCGRGAMLAGCCTATAASGWHCAHPWLWLLAPGSPGSRPEFWKSRLKPPSRGPPQQTRTTPWCSEPLFCASLPATRLQARGRQACGRCARAVNHRVGCSDRNTDTACGARRGTVFPRCRSWCGAFAGRPCGQITAHRGAG